MQYVTGAYDAVVIGAGFFGARLALLLARAGLRVALVERAAELFSRASYANQARVHNGYHYPRSYSTAFGSSKHYDRFLAEMQDCVTEDFEHIYAIARDSYTSAYQFQQFCRALGLPLRAPKARHRALFSRERIEDIFLVREGAFDSKRMREHVARRIAESPLIDLLCNTACLRLDLGGDRAVATTTRGNVEAAAVFLVAYAGINAVLRSSGLPLLDLKAEIAEVCLVDPPPALEGLGVTIMDGPFFSCMPMPAERRHSLTHVRYTPHASWNMRTQHQNSYDVLERAQPETRFLFMRKDAERYIPAMAGVRYAHSLWEIKAIPNRHELDDGRPILMRVHETRPLCVSILGSKFDSVSELEAAVPRLVETFLELQRSPDQAARQ